MDTDVMDLTTSEPESLVAETEETGEEQETPELESINVRFLGDAICDECGARLDGSAATAEASGRGIYRHPWHAVSNAQEKCRFAGKSFSAPVFPLKPI